MRMLTVLTVLASKAALSQVYIGPGGMGVQLGPPVVQVAPPVVQAAYPLSYQPHPQGFTQLQVLVPAGMQVTVYEGYAPVTSSVGPLLAPVLPGHFYRVVFMNPDGTRWEQTVQAQPGMIATLGYAQAPPPPPAPVYVAPQPAPPPPGPMVLPPREFANLVAAINQAAFPADKIAVLSTAAPNIFFTCAQVGRLIDLYAFPADKVRSVAIVHGHIVDPQNEFELYGHFAFPSDRERVRLILSR